MTAQPYGLIAILLDASARLDERDDAAIDLAKYDDGAVVAALLRIAGDPAEDEMLQASAGESLGSIWKRKGEADPIEFDRLTAAARVEALAALRCD